MKRRLAKKLLKALLALLAVAGVAILILSFMDQRERSDLEATRKSLREQGFKVDLAEFDFSTPAEFRAREAALTRLDFTARLADVDSIDLMPVVRDDSALVIWKQDWVTAANEEIRWTQE